MKLLLKFWVEKIVELLASKSLQVYSDSPYDWVTPGGLYRSAIRLHVYQNTQEIVVLDLEQRLNDFMFSTGKLSETEFFASLDDCLKHVEQVLNTSTTK